MPQFIFVVHMLDRLPTTHAVKLSLGKKVVAAMLSDYAGWWETTKTPGKTKAVRRATDAQQYYASHLAKLVSDYEQDEAEEQPFNITLSVAGKIANLPSWTDVPAQHIFTRVMLCFVGTSVRPGRHGRGHHSRDSPGRVRRLTSVHSASVQPVLQPLRG